MPRRLFASAVLIFVATEAASAGELRLACAGGGDAAKISPFGGGVTNNWGDTATIQGWSTENVNYEDVALIDIVDGEGKIRLPRSLLPPLHGGEGGWFKLKKLTQGDREITASAAVNIINAPTIRIDRYSGVISISGRIGSFTGQCRKVDAGSARAF